MFKTFAVLVLSVSVASCNHSESGGGTSCDASNETCLFGPTDLDADYSEGELPNEALTFDTNLTLANFSNSQQDKVLKAAEILRQIVASEEFRDAVINHTYNGEKTFVDNGGLTNTQIYQRFLKGAEKLTPTQNNTLDAELELYYANTSTIGYTYPNTKRIWMNTKYFNEYTQGQVAANLTHEWMHKLGFGHDSSYNTARSYSVPYALGYIVSKLAKSYPD